MKAKKRFMAALLAAFFAGASFAAGGGRIELAALDKIKPGVTTATQVREMLGPPARGPMSFPKRGIEAVEYDAEDFGDCYTISISYGGDGVVREVMKLRRGGV